MKFFDAGGRKKTLAKASSYAIDWDGKCRSKFQMAVRDFVRPSWESDVVFEEFRIVGTRLSLDIYNASKKVAIEVQGRQHNEFVEFFQKSRANYLDQLKRDEKKLTFCNMNDITLIEIYDIKECTKEFFESKGVYL